jgi:tetratricopeptide (TPR) repeat protein
VKLLEQMADALLIEGETARAAEVLREAAQYWQTRGQPNDARRCHDRANVADPSSARTQGAPSGVHATPATARPSGAHATPATARPSAVGPRDGLKSPFAANPQDLPPAPTARAGQAPGDPPAFSASGGFERSPQFVAPGSPAESIPAPADEEPAVPAEGVYDIGTEAGGSYERALNEAEATQPATDPYARRGAADAMSPSVVARRPVLPGTGVARVETLLARAQEEFRSGRRDAASEALVEAAQAYEGLGRLDSAATIFRSLGRGAQAPIPVMELWLANCEKRGDQAEGSQVACELGDRALNDGQDARARGWFEHAAALDPANDTARRRLVRLSQKPSPPAPVANGEPVRRVEVAVGRAEAVTFDLEGLLAEFQRGVDTQLEGDAQGHYDMGMAYREMGLHEQALDSFRIAQRDPRLALLCHEMSGRSLADAGQHEGAVREFTMALKAGGLDGAGEAELRYLTALSLAALGDPAGAVAQLEIADMRFPGRADITQRLAEWRRAFGQAA